MIREEMGGDISASSLSTSFLVVSLATYSSTILARG
jgi:hypothetical protein